MNRRDLLIDLGIAFIIAIGVFVVAHVIANA